AFPDSRVPLMLFDGSATIRLTSDCNQGWEPNEPTDSAPLVYTYRPRRYEPLHRPGNPTWTVLGYYAYTRGGLAGVDLSGNEIDTGQNPWAGILRCYRRAPGPVPGALSCAGGGEGPGWGVQSGRAPGRAAGIAGGPR